MTWQYAIRRRARVGGIAIGLQYGNAAAVVVDELTVGLVLVATLQHSQIKQGATLCKH